MPGTARSVPLLALLALVLAGPTTGCSHLPFRRSRPAPPAAATSEAPAPEATARSEEPRPARGVEREVDPEGEPAVADEADDAEDAEAADAEDAGAAQEPEADPSAGPPPEPASLPRTPREGFLPRLDVLFPEGELDLRVSRLIDKVFFEGQVQYNFIDGDITSFLRYRYYGYERVYQITGFDSLEFEGVEEFSSDFERVRGFLVLTQWPHDYHHRTTLLAEIDRITSNKEALQFDTDKTNTFLRVGYQIGTPNDPRSNAIVGEPRAQVERLFTAFREVGPGDFGLSAALTYGFEFIGGDFDYVKGEFEGLKRFEIGPPRHFLIGRLHGGTFPLKTLRDEVRAGEERELADRYKIPRSELFRLDGRDSLKGLDERIRGTEQLYTTWEYFFPWFVNRERRALGLTWQNWYWILYGGYGVTGFDRDVYTDVDLYFPDVGIGFESSFRLKKYTVFLSGIVAQALEGEGGVEAKASIKSYH